MLMFSISVQNSKEQKPCHAQCLEALCAVNNYQCESNNIHSTALPCVKCCTNVRKCQTHKQFDEKRRHLCRYLSTAIY